MTLRGLLSRTGAGRPALALSAALALAACAQTGITWRSAERFEPLPEDAPIALFVRSSAPPDLREAMHERGAEDVAAFPPGERVAEFGSVSAPWTDFDVVLDDVREGARRLGADIALATGSDSSLTGETRVLFQLLRSRPHDVAPRD